METTVHLITHLPSTESPVTEELDFWHGVLTITVSLSVHLPSKNAQ